VHPDTRRVLAAYGRERGIEIVTVPARDGAVDEAALSAAADDGTAAVVLQTPNFFGVLERMDRLIPLVRRQGALCVAAWDPLAAGMFKPPGAFEADVVVGEGQALGIPLQYGGPYLGLLAAREAHLRKMPGRVVGMTTDREGRRAFCLALQTREQHIRREKATSNVCTNQGLLAVRAAIYLAAMGKQGLRRAASLCFEKAHYAAEIIGRLRGYQIAFPGPFFREFAVRTTRGVSRALKVCRERGILGGVPLDRFDEKRSDCFLVAVTEKRTRAEIDALAAALDAA
jgi:glycine dehydrogenase subunit 1